MTNTTLSLALERAGLRPRIQSLESPRYGERSAIEFVDTAALSDANIIEESSMHRVQIADIKRQLDDDKEAGIARGEVWRSRAKRAVRAKQLRLDQLSEEARKRGLIAALPELANKVLEKEIDRAAKTARMELERQRQEEQKRQADELRQSRELEHQKKIEIQKQQREEKQMANRQRNLTQCEMFVKAAYQIYSRDDCEKIWDRAKELFPGNPGWDDGP